MSDFQTHSKVTKSLNGIHSSFVRSWFSALTSACLISAACTVLGLVFAFFFYEESLPALANRHRRSSSISSEATLVEESLLPQDQVKLWGFWELWSLKSIRVMGLSLLLNTYVAT